MASSITALPLPEGTGAIVSLQTAGQTAGAVQMTTAAIEQAINDLAALRAELMPKVKDNPGDQYQLPITENARVFVAEPTPDGQVVIAACNNGLGWLAFSLAPEHAKQVGALLVQIADNVLGSAAPRH